MMFETNWVADFPDGDNFYQLLYGPNAGRANYARFNLPAYNQRYEQARVMGESPQRTALYDEMAQLIHAYTPWVLLTHPISADLQQPWLKKLSPPSSGVHQTGAIWTSTHIPRTERCLE